MNDQTLLHRQINPFFVKCGEITSQVFTPKPNDRLLLSVYNGDTISPADSFRHYTRRPECRSVGTVSVIRGECLSLSLPAGEDPLDDNPDHAVIDFSNAESKSAVRKLAEKLKDFALARGWTHGPIE